jgi:hypothetical protein
MEQGSRALTPAEQQLKLYNVNSKLLTFVINFFFAFPHHATSTAQVAAAVIAQSTHVPRAAAGHEREKRYGIQNRMLALKSKCGGVLAL